MQGMRGHRGQSQEPYGLWGRRVRMKDDTMHSAVWTGVELREPMVRKGS
jgi:hypothetical protein